MKVSRESADHHLSALPGPIRQWHLNKYLILQTTRKLIFNSYKVSKSVHLHNSGVIRWLVFSIIVSVQFFLCFTSVLPRLENSFQNNNNWVDNFKETNSPRKFSHLSWRHSWFLSRLENGLQPILRARAFYWINNIHEKLTRFWLAESRRDRGAGMGRGGGEGGGPRGPPKCLELQRVSKKRCLVPPPPHIELLTVPPFPKSQSCSAVPALCVWRLMLIHHIRVIQLQVVVLVKSTE